MNSMATAKKMLTHDCKIVHFLSVYFARQVKWQEAKDQNPAPNHCENSCGSTNSKFVTSNGDDI